MGGTRPPPPTSILFYRYYENDHLIQVTKRNVNPGRKEKIRGRQTHVFVINACTTK